MDPIINDILVTALLAWSIAQVSKVVINAIFYNYYWHLVGLCSRMLCKLYLMDKYSCLTPGNNVAVTVTSGMLKKTMTDEKTGKC